MDHPKCQMMHAIHIRPRRSKNDARHSQAYLDRKAKHARKLARRKERKVVGRSRIVMRTQDLPLPSVLDPKFHKERTASEALFWRRLEEDAQKIEDDARFGDLTEEEWFAQLGGPPDPIEEEWFLLTQQEVESPQEMEVIDLTGSP